MALTGTTSTRYQFKKQLGDINLIVNDLKAALMTGDFVFDRNKHKVWTADMWSGETSYSIGKKLIPTSPNGFVYDVISGETSAAIEPSWPTTFGEKVVDNNGMEYECWSYETLRGGDTFSGEISASGEYTRQLLSLTDSDAGQNVNEVDNAAYVHYDNIKFTASGEAFNPTGACVIFDDSVSEKTIIGCYSFNDTYTVNDGNYIELKDPEIEDIAKENTV